MYRSVLFFSLFLLIAPSLTGQWQIEAPGTGKPGSIAVDSTGKVYIAYIDNLVWGDVVLAVRENGQWTDTTLTSNIESNAVSLALDTDGRPHLVYAEANNAEFNTLLKYICYTGSAWTSPETLVTTEADMMTWSPTIRIDKDDHVHITYLLTEGDAGSGEIYYLKNTSGDWESTKLNDKYQNPAQCDVSMALDSDGHVHLVSYFPSLGGPGYYTNTPDGQWIGPELIQPGWFGGQLEGLFIDISLDPDNHPHVSYVGSSDGSAIENHMVATKPGQVAPWDFQKIDDGSFNSSGNAIACDPDGVEHIAYYHIGSGELRYSMNYSGSWSHETITTLNDTYHFFIRRLEIASDKDGYIHIVYEDNGKVRYATNRIELPAPYIVLSPTALAFGSVDTGQVVTKSLYIKNEGVLDLHLSEVTLAGGDSVEFSLDHLCSVIVPDDSCEVQVGFAPVLPGEKQTSLLIASDDPDMPVVNAAITGRTPYPVITVNPDSLEFNPVEVGETDQQSLTIGNIGDADLEIDSLEVTGEAASDYAPNSSCLTISPSGNCTINIIFDPGEVGVHKAVLHIYSNDPYHPEVTIPLEGRTPSACIEIKAEVIDFGAVAEGTLATAQLVIENTGERQLNISSVDISGTDEDLFRCSNSCGVISAGGKCTLDLTFHPVSIGQKNALLSISSNDPDQPLKSVILMGTAGENQSLSFKYAGGEEKVIFFGMDTLSTGEFIVAGQSGQDGYLAALSSRGEIHWQKQYNTGNNTGNVIAVARETWDHGLVAGGKMYGRYRWIARLDPNGEIIWQKRAEDDYWGCIHDLQVTPDSGFIAVGETWPRGPGDPDMWIGKFDSTGAVIWQKIIGEPYSGSERGMAVLVRPDGSFIIKEGFNLELPLGALLNHPDGGYVVAGESGYLWKISSAGDVLWQKFLDVYTGAVWMGHFSPSDQLLWSYKYSYPVYSRGIYDLSFTSQGNILAVGYAEDPNTNMIVLQTKSNGKLIWAKRFRYLWDEGYKILGLPDGNAAYAGHVEGSQSSSDSYGWFGILTPGGNVYGCDNASISDMNTSQEIYSFSPETVNLPVSVDQVAFVDAELSVAEDTLVRETLCTGIPEDIDRDGVTDEEESGPDGTNRDYDGNGDGLPDSQEANVASLHSFDGSAYLCLETGPGISLQDVSASDNPSPDDQPGDFDFDLGFFSFTLSGIEEGGEAALTLLIPPGSEPDTYYKYAATADNNDPHWYEFLYNGITGAEIYSGNIVLHFLDGGRGDEDLSVNGEVKDIGGPAMQSPNTGQNELITGNAQNVLWVYPNPLSGMARIYLHLGGSGHVLVECYDPLGRKVSTLADQHMQAGEHILLWDTGALPAGNYFLLLRTGNGNSIRKVVVIK